MYLGIDNYYYRYLFVIYAQQTFPFPYNLAIGRKLIRLHIPNHSIMLFTFTGISTVFGGTQCNCHQCQNEAVCSYNNTCDCIEDYVGDTCSERYSERCGGRVMCQNGAECVYDEGG